MPREFSEGLIGHAAIVRILESALANPAPSYLFVGQTHVGKHAFAERFVRVLLGLEPDAEHWRSHPDVVILEQEEGKSQVSVEQVRALRERVALRPMRASRIVVYVPSADRLNESGTNALLKVIEEPPADAVFIFVSEDLGRIPLTVRSRSVTLPFGTVPVSVIAEALCARGISQDEAQARAASSRGRPGLAVDSSNVTAGGSVFVRQFLGAPNTDARLAFIEELSKACESAEDPGTAWREALLFGMQEVRSSLIADPQRALMAGAAMLTALRFVGSAVSPRLALEACAAHLSADPRRILPRLFPSPLSSSIPPIFSLPTNI